MGSYKTDFILVIAVLYLTDIRLNSSAAVSVTCRSHGGIGDALQPAAALTVAPLSETHDNLGIHRGTARVAICHGGAPRCCRKLKFLIDPHARLSGHNGCQWPTTHTTIVHIKSS
eukprot:5822923-Pleurochrysis_carterae.AAC.1